MIDHSDAADVIGYLRGAGLSNLKDADPVTWADALNAASLYQGESKPKLKPTPEEALDAARTMVVEGVRFPQVSDLVTLIRGDRAHKKKERGARVREAIEKGGPLTPDGLGGDVDAELEWRRSVVRMIGDGADRDQAERIAYEIVGMRRPELPAVDGDVRGLVKRLAGREFG